ncbi:MAG: hypothetical protein ACK5P5_13470 [Pseudobdellovibrionaceae bacterium]
MADIDPELLEGFLEESKKITVELLEILENLEGSPENVAELANFGNQVDRIMGGAKSIAIMVPNNHALHLIADYSELCKIVGYKGSQIKNNEQFFEIVVALLLDATETLEILLNGIDKPISTLKSIFTHTFVERLKWVSHQFGEGFSQTVDSQKLGQDEIDKLMSKLGL